MLILDKEGSRLFAKYYQPSSDYDGEVPANPYKTQTQQLKFEEAVFGKINKVHQDILLFDNHLITYKQTNDIILIIVTPIDENESLVYSLTSNLNEALTILLNNTLDKETILKKYDLVSLCIDETIDDGLILEIDPAIIVSRVTKAPVAGKNIPLDISEKSIFDALSFASKKIGERLQQGL